MHHNHYIKDTIVNCSHHWAAHRQKAQTPIKRIKPPTGAKPHSPAVLTWLLIKRSIPPFRFATKSDERNNHHTKENWRKVLKIKVAFFYSISSIILALREACTFHCGPQWAVCVIVSLWTRSESFNVLKLFSGWYFVTDFSESRCHERCYLNVLVIYFLVCYSLRMKSAWYDTINRYRSIAAVILILISMTCWGSSQF